MSGLFDLCSRLFKTKDLYEVLGVSNTANEKELKRGYHKLSLQVHPDRVSAEDKDVATEKFQTLGKVYAILSDKDTRALYDETGEVDEENDVAQDRDWTEYWRLLYPKVSAQDIKEFEQKYKDSEEELSDLKSAYRDFRGDMDEILDNVMCASVDDEPRFRRILTELVDNKELPKYKAFTGEKKAKQTERKRRAASEAAEAEAAAAELGLNDDNSLRNLIAQRQASRARGAEDFFSQLEQKYAAPKTKGKKKK